MKRKNRKPHVARARALRRRETPAEAFFWAKVRRKQLEGYKFYRQYAIPFQLEGAGLRFFYADFYNREKRLVVELDGPIHQERTAYDQDRTAILEGMGHHVIRFTNEEVLGNWLEVRERLLEVMRTLPPAPSL